MPGSPLVPRRRPLSTNSSCVLRQTTISQAILILLIFLGLGEDGHTASLCPGAPVLRDHQRVIAATQSPKDPPNRLTMTLGVINRASVIMFLVTGARKAGVVRAILDLKTEAERRHPASLVEPEQGRLIWFLDRSAAAGLPIH
jgi:6-phosphogluconolactonase